MNIRVEGVELHAGISFSRCSDLYYEIIFRRPIEAWWRIIFSHYIRIFNWENNKHINQTQETMNTVFFLGETINGENPETSSEIESPPNVKPPKQ